MSNLFHRLYSTYVFEDGDRITHNESAYMRPIISVLDTPERTQSVGSPADSLAWGVLQVDENGTTAGQVDDHKPNLVSLDNLAVRARAFQAADLLASCRQNKSRHLSYGLALRERSNCCRNQAGQQKGTLSTKKRSRWKE
jgi:hypothetical protein